MIDKISKIVFIIAVASIPFDVVCRMGIIRLTLTEILFSIVIMLWLYQVVKGKMDISYKPYFLFLTLFIISCSLSLINSQNYGTSIREIIQFIWLFCLFYFVSNYINDVREVNKIMLVLIISASCVSLVGLYQYFFVNTPYHFQISSTRLRSHGIFDQPNTFGNFLSGVVPVLFGIYVFTITQRASQRKYLRVIALLVLSFIIFSAFITTFSRGSWIALSVGLIILFFLLLKKYSFKIIIPFVAVLFVAIAIIWIDIMSQPGLIERKFSSQQRALLAETAIKMYKSYPVFGIGLGNFQTRLKEFAPQQLITLSQTDYDEQLKKEYTNPNKEIDIELVHNMLLQILTEIGIIGLLTFLLVLYIFFKEALKLLKKSGSDEIYCIRSAMLCSVIAILVSGMFGWPFSHGVQELLLLVMGLSVNVNFSVNI